MLGLHTAVTRTTPEGLPEGGWYPGERLALKAAIDAYTSGAAWASFDEQRKGTPRRGHARRSRRAVRGHLRSARRRDWPRPVSPSRSSTDSIVYRPRRRRRRELDRSDARNHAAQRSGPSRPRTCPARRLASGSRSSPADRRQSSSRPPPSTPADPSTCPAAIVSSSDRNRGHAASRQSSAARPSSADRRGPRSSATSAAPAGRR